jgi:hypothetical protein
MASNGGESPQRRGCGFFEAYWRNWVFCRGRRVRDGAFGSGPWDPTLPWDLRATHTRPQDPLGFKDDIMGVDIATVALDRTQWEMMAAVNISGTTARTLHLLAAEPDEEVIGPHKASNMNVRTINTRGGVYTPFEFVPIVLGQNLTGREAHLLLVPAILDAGLESICHPLIDWLTVANTGPSVTALEPVNLKQCLGRVHCIPSQAVVSSRRSEVLYRDLLGLKATPGGGGDPYLRDVARAVGDLAVEFRADHSDRQDRRSALDQPKGV